MAVPFGDLPDRFEPAGVPVGTAFVLPGRSYSPAAPPLEFARQAALQHGWAVRQVWWDSPATLETWADPIWSDWVGEQLAAAVAQEPVPPERVLVIGKSLGTRAATYAARRGWPGVWFTPLLTVPEVVAGLRANRAPQLLLCGLDDALHDPAVARELAGGGCGVCEVAGVGHTLWAEADAVRSAEAQVELSRAVEGFLTALDDRPHTETEPQG